MSVYDELSGRGWVQITQPPSFGGSVVGLYDGKPIKAGVEVRRIEDSQDCIHTRYRTGTYHVDVKVDETGGYARVEEA